MRLTRYLVLCLVLAAGLAVASISPTLALPAKNELTFSASLFNPDDGTTVWTATGELLLGISGGHLLLGPSVSLFDAGDTDGGAYGAALEWNLTGKQGLFVGGAAHVPNGDLADAYDYDYSARAGVKLGTERWFGKLFASQVWTQAADGSTTDPDGTSFQAGIGARW